MYLLGEILPNAILSDTGGIFPKALNSKKARNVWEAAFNMTYIEPLLQNLDKKLKESMSDVLADHDDKSKHNCMCKYCILRIVKGAQSRK